MRKYFKAYVKSQNKRRGAAAAVLQRAVRTRNPKPESLHRQGRDTKKKPKPLTYKAEKPETLDIQGRDTHKAEKRLGADRRR